ncbi:MAG: hypothetical protein U9R15_08635 [Chloroflexota bacterium]|nr:hypothetical protein [Chloroflexota bacterium]
MIELKKTTCKKLVKGAKGKTSGPWEGICKGIDNKKCRDAITYLGEKGEAGLTDVKKQLGKKYDTFIERYNKEYERVKAEAEEKRRETKKPPVEKKTVVVKEEPPVEKGLSKEEWSSFDELRELITTKPSIKTLEEYMKLFDNLSPDQKKELIESITDEERKTLLALAKERQKLKESVLEAREDLKAKIPREEIEALRHPLDPTEEPWDIDVAVFVPVGVGITLGRIKPITDAVEIFAIYFHGRALPEMVTVISYLFISEFEEKTSKLMSYYTAMSAKLLALQGYSILRPAAIEAARRLDVVMGIAGRAKEISEELERAIIK